MPVSPSIFCKLLEDSSGPLSEGQGNRGKNQKSFTVSLWNLGNAEFDFSGKPDLKCLAEGTEDAIEKSLMH